MRGQPSAPPSGRIRGHLPPRLREGEGILLDSCGGRRPPHPGVDQIDFRRRTVVGNPASRPVYHRSPPSGRGCGHLPPRLREGEGILIIDCGGFAPAPPGADHIDFRGPKAPAPRVDHIDFRRRTVVVNPASRPVYHKRPQTKQKTQDKRFAPYLVLCFCFKVFEVGSRGGTFSRKSLPRVLPRVLPRASPRLRDGTRPRCRGSPYPRSGRWRGRAGWYRRRRGRCTPAPPAGQRR